MSRSAPRVALNGWFASRPVGSGAYTDALLAALRATAEPGEAFALLRPSRRAAGALGKLAWEQRGFPRAAAGFDLAHVPYWAPPLRPTVPTLVTVHDLIPLLLPDYRRRRSVRAYTALVARASRSAAAILVDSEHGARDVRANLDVDPARVHVVPLGVDARFRPQAPERLAELCARLDLPERFGLHVGGFDRRKNLETLIQAWVAVHAGTGLPLVLAGRPPAPGDSLHPDPRALARRAGLPESALRLPGFVTDADLPTLYAAATLFAFPSRYEGFGLGPLEAMACGTPVLASDASSLPEVVGEAGLLLPPDDPAAWSEALRRLLDDPGLADRMRAAGLARAAEFTWVRTARRTRAVYASLLGR
ncbi:MAG: glycosyltransferase family 4 protein [Chloroflexi bacterium]|nr:glycosyltransferase family 4 protein [Chloroflexota bacterium]